MRGVDAVLGGLGLGVHEPLAGRLVGLARGGRLLGERRAVGPCRVGQVVEERRRVRQRVDVRHVVAVELPGSLGRVNDGRLVVDEFPVERVQVREPRADGEEDVGTPEVVVRRLHPRSADRPERQPVRLGERATRGLRRRDRDVERLREPPDGASPVGPPHLGADHQEGLVRAGEQVGRPVDGVARRARPGRRRPEVPLAEPVESRLVRVREVRLLEVPREVDVDRAGHAGHRPEDRVADLLARPVVRDLDVVLGEPLEDAGDVPLVADAHAEPVGRLVARDGDHRDVVSIGGAHAQRLVGGPGTDVRDGNRRLARGERVAGGHRRRHLLVAGGNELHVALGDLVEQAQDGRAGQAEGVLHAGGFQRLREDAGASHAPSWARAPQIGSDSPAGDAVAGQAPPRRHRVG